MHFMETGRGRLFKALPILPLFMLPTHRPSPALEHLSRLKNGSNPFSRFLTRWILLGFALIVAIWFARPLLEDFIWAQPPELNPPRYGHRPPMKQPPPSLDEQALWDLKKNEVKDTFKHAWAGYLSNAFPSDELNSVSGGKSDR